MSDTGDTFDDSGNLLGQQLSHLQLSGQSPGITGASGIPPSIMERLAKVPEWMDKLLQSDDLEERKDALVNIRKLLSCSGTPPIDQVLNGSKRKLVPTLIRFLQLDYPEFQGEAAWCLSNIASGNSIHTQLLIDHGAISAFCKLLRGISSTNNPVTDEVKQNAIWALGNIAGDNYQNRNNVLNEANIMDILLDILQNIDESKKHSLDLGRTAVWSLSNLCRGKPVPPFEMIRPVLPILAHLLNVSKDESVLTDTLWCLSFITDYSDISIKEVLSLNIAKKIIEFMGHSNPTIQVPALRTVGNITTGTDEQTQVILDAGALLHFKNLLKDQRANIRKEVCWAISNICADSSMQIKCVARHECNIFPNLFHVLLTDENQNVKKEASWAVSNAITGSTDDDLIFIVEKRAALPVIIQALKKKHPDHQYYVCLLLALDAILKIGEEKKMNFKDRVEKFGGLDVLEGFQNHISDKVYRMAIDILTKYFELEDDDEDDCTDDNSRS